MVRQDQTHDVNADLDAIKSDLSKLRTDMADMASTWMNRGREQAASAADTVKEKVQSSVSGLEDWVREQPMKAVLIAAGVGLILGKLSSRR